MLYNFFVSAGLAASVCNVVSVLSTCPSFRQTRQQTRNNKPVATSSREGRCKGILTTGNADAICKTYDIILV